MQTSCWKGHTARPAWRVAVLQARHCGRSHLLEGESSSREVFWERSSWHKDSRIRLALDFSSSLACQMVEHHLHILKESDLPGIFYLAQKSVTGLPWRLSEESTCNARDPVSVPGLGTSPGEGNGYTPVFLPGESHGPRSLVGYSPRGRKGSDTAERLTHGSQWGVKIQ